MDQATQIALDSILTTNAQNYADTAFLNNSIGTTYSGLHRLPESPKELMFHWCQPGNVGNTGGSSSKPHGTHVWSPGDPALFTCNGVPKQEDNFYFYMPLPIPAVLPLMVVDDRAHQIADLTNWQGLEWQEQITLNGKIYNMAYQFSLSSGVRIYDKTHEQWIATPTTIPLPDFTKGVKTRCLFALGTSGVTHVSITINGVPYPVGVTQAATPTQNANKFTIAEQVDPQKGGVCSLGISQIDLRFF